MSFPFHIGETKLLPGDLSLFSAHFSRAVAHFIPSKKIYLFPCLPASLATLQGVPSRWAEGVDKVTERQLPVFSSNGATLYLPVWGETELVGVSVFEGIEEKTLENCSVPWLLDRSRLISRELRLCKQAFIDPLTGLGNGQHLWDGVQLLLDEVVAGRLATRAVPCNGFTLILLEAYPRVADAGKGERSIARVVRLLFSILGKDQRFHHFGCGVFGLLLPGVDIQQAKQLGESFLAGLRREKVLRAHLGLRTILGTDPRLGELTVEGIVHQAWNALEKARTMAPLALCSYNALLSEPPVFPSLPATILTALCKLWRRQGAFAVALLRYDEDQGETQFWETMGALVGPHPVFPLDAREAYVFLAGLDADSALQWAGQFKQRIGALGIQALSIGIAAFPFHGFSKAVVLMNARKALLHCAFLGTGAVAAFDAVSLNISGDIFFNQGDLNAAIKEYQRGLALSAGNVNLLNSLGVSYAKLGRYRLAIACFEKALASSPHDLMAAYNLGSAYFQTGRWADAVAPLEIACAAEGNTEEQLLLLGRVYLQVGRHEEALHVLQKAEEHDPERGVVQRYLGEALFAVGQRTGAMASLQKALRINPRDPWALSLLGLAYAIEKQGDEIALSLCQQALALDEGSWQFWCRLGFVQLHTKQVEAALDTLRQGQRLNRKSREIASLLGQVYAQGEKPGYAKRYFKKVLQLEAGHEGAAGALLGYGREGYGS